MAFKPKTAGIRLSKAVPGGKPMPSLKPTKMDAMIGGPSNKKGSAKSYAK